MGPVHPARPDRTRLLPESQSLYPGARASTESFDRVFGPGTLNPDLESPAGASGRLLAYVDVLGREIAAYDLARGQWRRPETRP